jgi:hypothetical protein
MVNVYKTNVNNRQQALLLLSSLSEQLPGRYINFDLEDCDKILRVEGTEIDSRSVVDHMTQHGFYCSELPD